MKFNPMARTSPFFLGLVLLMAGVAPAASQNNNGVSRGNATLENFAWLEGTWEGLLDVGDGFALAEVQYLAPKGGVILGSFRLTKDESVLVLELLSLVVVDSLIEIRMRHFSNTLDPWENDAPIVLTLESATDSLFTFRNHVNDSPRWSFFAPQGPNQFKARSEIYSKAGEMSIIEIVYERRVSGAAGRATGQR